MNPLISVIVPIYNVEAYLPRCLDSIVNQTYQNLEIILVDDGSPDNCGAICDEYASRDSRIRVIRKENGGVSSARNAGLDVMQGEYLTFVDPDDWLSLDAVQVLYDRLVEDGSDMAIGRHTDVYADGRENDGFCRWMTDCIFTPNEIFAALGDRQRFAVTSWSKLYRRELFLDLRYPPISCGEDNWIYPYLIQKCRRVSSVDHLVYYYYQFEKSIMHVYNSGAQLGNLEANLRMTKFLLDRNCLKAADTWYANSIDNAWRVEKQTAASALMDQYFSRSEQIELLKKHGIEKTIKWLAVHNHLLNLALHRLVKVKKWKK